MYIYISLLYSILLQYSQESPTRVSPFPEGMLGIPSVTKCLGSFVGCGFLKNHHEQTDSSDSSTFPGIYNAYHHGHICIEAKICNSFGCDTWAEVGAKQQFFSSNLHIPFLQKGHTSLGWLDFRLHTVLCFLNCMLLSAFMWHTSHRKFWVCFTSRCSSKSSLIFALYSHWSHFILDAPSVLFGQSA